MRHTDPRFTARVYTDEKLLPLAAEIQNVPAIIISRFSFNRRYNLEFTKLIIVAVFKMFSRKADIVAENISLRQQLAVYKRKHKRIPIKNSDRIFWVLISKIWTKWKSVLIIVKPETVIRWHRDLFKIYWRWKSKDKTGRPEIHKELRELIRRIQLENPRWSAQRIHGELLQLNFKVFERTVAKYMLNSATKQYLA